MWIASTSTIVVYAKNRIVVTGATKPANLWGRPPVDNSSPSETQSLSKKAQKRLRQLDSPVKTQLIKSAKSMSSIRLGDDFSDIIHQCSKLYSDKAYERDQSDRYLIDPHKVTEMSDSEIESVYATYSRWPRCIAHNHIPQESTYCWALDGYDFTPKNPCVRCIYLYSDWILAGRPQTVQDKRESLAGLHGSQMLYHNDWLPPCGYCAETVAAASIFRTQCCSSTLFHQSSQAQSSTSNLRSPPLPTLYQPAVWVETLPHSMASVLWVLRNLLCALFWICSHHTSPPELHFSSW